MRRELGIWGQAGGRHRGLREKGRFELPRGRHRGAAFRFTGKVFGVARGCGGSRRSRRSVCDAEDVPYEATPRPARSGRTASAPDPFRREGWPAPTAAGLHGPVWPPRIKRARVARGQRVTGPAQALATVTRPSRDGEEKPSDCRCPKQPAHLHGMAAFSKQDVLQVTLRTLRDGLRPYPPLRTPPRPSARSSLHTPPAGITPSVPWALGGG